MNPMGLNNFTEEFGTVRACKNVVFCIAIKKTEQRDINRINRCMEKIQDQMAENPVEKAFVWGDRDACSKGFSQTTARENYYIGFVDQYRNISHSILLSLLLLEEQQKKQVKSENELYLFVNSSFGRTEASNMIKILEAFKEIRLKIHLVKDDSNEKIRPDSFDKYVKEHDGEIYSMQTMLI